MLNLIYSVSPLDIKLKNFITNPTSFYKMCKQEGWILAPPFKDIISDIDNSDIVDDGVLYNRRYKVKYSDDKLSGGTHMLLLMYHLNLDTKYAFDLNACGPNCAKWLPYVTMQRNVVARIGYPMPINPTDDWPVVCLNDNTVMTSKDDFKRMHMLFCNSNAEGVIYPEGYV